MIFPLPACDMLMSVSNLAGGMCDKSWQHSQCSHVTGALVSHPYWWLSVQEAGDALMGMTAAQMHELEQQEEQAGMGEEESLAEQARRRALFRPWLMRLRISQQTYRDDISIRKTISRWCWAGAVGMYEEVWDLILDLLEALQPLADAAVHLQQTPIGLICHPSHPSL